jgi:hypothetical protein
VADDLDTGAVLSATDRLMRTLRGPMGGAASWEWSDLLAAATGRSPFEFTSLAREAGLAVPNPSNVQPADIAAQLVRVARGMEPTDRASVTRVARLLDPSLPERDLPDADTHPPIEDVASGAPEVEAPGVAEAAAATSLASEPAPAAGSVADPAPRAHQPPPPPAPAYQHERPVPAPPPAPQAMPGPLATPDPGPSPHPSFRTGPPHAPGRGTAAPPPPPSMPSIAGPTMPPRPAPPVPPTSTSDMHFPKMPPVDQPRTVPDAQPKKRNPVGRLIWLGVLAFFVIRGLIEGDFGGG